MMKKADKSTWNNTWDNSQGKVNISNIDKLIFQKINNLVEFQGKETIELGCGRGVLSSLMLKNGAKACALVDFSDSALMLARTLFDDDDNVEFIFSDLFKTDETKKYDIVFSSGVAEHFSDSLREEIIYKHLRLTKEIAVLIVPARPHYNTIRHRKKKLMALYGWQYSFSKKEINDIVNKVEGFDIVLNQRFYPLYGVNLSGFFAINDKFVFSRLWNSALYRMDIVLAKIGIYKFIDMLLSPFSNQLGGLLITIIKKRW